MEVDARRHELASHCHIKLTGGGKKLGTYSVWSGEKNTYVCVYTGSGEGSDLQVHPKLPQTGSGGSSAAEVETREKDNRRCAYSESVALLSGKALLMGGSEVSFVDKKSCTVLPVCNNPSHHYRQQKALFEPQTRR